MRPLLLAALLLTSCAPLATPAPLIPAAQQVAVSAEQMRDAGATAAVAAAAWEYAMLQTQQAATSTAQHAQQVATETQQAAQQRATLLAAEAHATQQAVAAAATMAAVSATVQSGVYVAASATVAAASATETRQWAGPVATGTALAQQAQQARESEDSRAWLVALIVAFLGVALGVAAGAYRWLDSRGVAARKMAEGEYLKAAAEAEKIRSQAQAQVVGKQPPALGTPGWIIVMVQGEPKQFELPALGVPAYAPQHQEPAEPEIANLTPEAHMTEAQTAMIGFVERAIEASPSGERSAYIPTDSAMGLSGSEWQAAVNALRKLALVVTSSGRPSAGAISGTRLIHSEYDSLGKLLAALVDGRVIIAPLSA